MKKIHVLSYILVVVLAVMVFIIIISTFTNEPFWGIVQTVILSICTSYIAAFIFYLIDVWMPSIIKKRKINDRLAVPLSRLLNSMKMPMSMVYKTYGDENPKFECISKELNKSLVSKMDLINDDAPMMIWPEKRPGNFGEYLIDHIKSANKYINKITYLPVDLEIDLIIILDNIESSGYHETMISVNNFNHFNKNSIRMEGNSIADSLYEYYLLFFELKNYMIKNNIKITLDNL